MIYLRKLLDMFFLSMIPSLISFLLMSQFMGYITWLLTCIISVLIFFIGNALLIRRFVRDIKSTSKYYVVWLITFFVYAGGGALCLWQRWMYPYTWIYFHTRIVEISVMPVFSMNEWISFGASMAAFLLLILIARPIFARSYQKELAKKEEDERESRRLAREAYHRRHGGSSSRYDDEDEEFGTGMEFAADVEAAHRNSSESGHSHHHHHHHHSSGEGESGEHHHHHHSGSRSSSESGSRSSSESGHRHHRSGSGSGEHHHHHHHHHRRSSEDEYFSGDSENRAYSMRQHRKMEKRSDFRAANRRQKIGAQKNAGKKTTNIVKDFFLNLGSYAFYQSLDEKVALGNDAWPIIKSYLNRKLNLGIRAQKKRR